MANPSRGEVWMADLGHTKGHEQAGRRPVVVISEDIYNQGPAGLVVVLPLTSTVRGIPIHVPVKPPEAGLKIPSVVLCDAIRSVSMERLDLQLGRVSSATMQAVEDRLRVLLDL